MQRDALAQYRLRKTAIRATIVYRYGPNLSHGPESRVHSSLSPPLGEEGLAPLNQREPPDPRAGSANRSLYIDAGRHRIYCRQKMRRLPVN